MLNKSRIFLRLAQEINTALRSLQEPYILIRGMTNVPYDRGDKADITLILDLLDGSYMEITFRDRYVEFFDGATLSYISEEYYDYEELKQRLESLLYLKLGNFKEKTNKNIDIY